MEEQGSEARELWMKDGSPGWGLGINKPEVDGSPGGVHTVARGGQDSGARVSTHLASRARLEMFMTTCTAAARCSPGSPTLSWHRFPSCVSQSPANPDSAAPFPP